MRMGRLLKIFLAAIIRGRAAQDKKKSGLPSRSFAQRRATKDKRDAQEIDA
jgi:hypothetical protein